MSTYLGLMEHLSAQELSGWLRSPEGNWCYRFHRDPKSWKRYPFVFVDKWSTKSDGTPSAMKSRSRLHMDDAIGICGQMLLGGWKKLTNHFDVSTVNNKIEEVAT